MTNSWPEAGPPWARRRRLAKILLATFAAGLVDLHVHAPEFVVEVRERPLASLLARWQVRETTMVTNLRHASIELEGHLVQHLLMLLDGTRDRAALLRDLAAAAAADPAALQEAGGLPTGGGDLVHVLAGGLEANLQKVARLALLVA